LAIRSVPSDDGCLPEIHRDRARRTPPPAWIYWAIRETNETSRFASRAALPSWRDLTAQFGVSRDTAVAYERLIAMVQSELPISVPVYHRLGPHLFATAGDRSDLDTTSALVGAPFQKA